MGLLPVARGLAGRTPSIRDQFIALVARFTFGCRLTAVRRGRYRNRFPQPDLFAVAQYRVKIISVVDTLRRSGKLDQSNTVNCGGRADRREHRDRHGQVDRLGYRSSSRCRPISWGVFAAFDIRFRTFTPASATYFRPLWPVLLRLQRLLPPRRRSRRPICRVETLTDGTTFWPQ